MHVSPIHTKEMTLRAHAHTQPQREVKRLVAISVPADHPLGSFLEDGSEDEGAAATTSTAACGNNFTVVYLGGRETLVCGELELGYALRSAFLRPSALYMHTSNCTRTSPAHQVCMSWHMCLMPSTIRDFPRYKSRMGSGSLLQKAGCMLVYNG